MIRIDILPDDVLLEIFGFYVFTSCRVKCLAEAWQTLVHVCRRWRSLVFRSPRRLDLQLHYVSNTPAKDTLDVWPPLPLTVFSTLPPASTDNIIVVLRQSKRVREVGFHLAGWELEKVLAVMQVPFPELTYLLLYSNDGESSVIPDSFLGGSAPRLQLLDLDRVPFLGLPNLLLSATQLVRLNLHRIPHSGYISPEAMVALISMLSQLEDFTLQFRSPQSRPDLGSRSRPPPKRSILPALHTFRFRGVTEYLEDLVTHIDAPQLNTFSITFFNQVDFDFPRLVQFINCTATLGVLDQAHVKFDDYTASVRFEYGTRLGIYKLLMIDVLCREPDWQLSSIEQVCNSSLHPLSAVQDLYIEHQYLRLVWKNDAIENSLWLQLLLPFTTVKNLYLSEEFAPGIAAALQELVGDRITEVLPGLQNIFVEQLEPSGPFRENFQQFVAARQVSGHPIAISLWS